MTALSASAAAAPDRGARPARYRVEGIPAELQSLPRWVVFQITRLPDGKTKKTPLIAGLPGKHLAEVNDPATWRTFDLALRDAEARRLYLAFAFGPDLPYFFVDADDVLKPDSAACPELVLLRDTLDTYTELSASGTGLHIIGRGAFPERCATPALPEGCGTLELYPKHGGRFCVFTGNTLPGLDTIEARQDVLDRLFPSRPARTATDAANGDGYHGPAGTLTDEETAAIIAWARPFWTDGRRHHLALYLTGYMAKQGVAREQAAHIIERCSREDSDPGAKLAACHATYDDLEAGESVSGWHGLIDACGLTEAELAPLAAILDAFWQRCQPRVGRKGEPGQPEEWSEPIPLTSWKEPPVFLPEYLPEPLAGMVAATAEALQMPAAAPGLSALSVASGSVARACEVQVSPGHIEPLNIFAVSVLIAGSRKSACDALLSAPVKAHERARREEMRPTITEAKRARRQAEKRQEHITKLLASKTGKHDWTALDNEAKALAQDLAPGGALTVPDEPQYLVEDVTPEKLADGMARNDMRMMVLSAEGTIFQAISDPYKKSGDSGLPLFLKTHAGDSMQIDRMSRAALSLEQPALTLGLGVQPDVLQELGQNAKYRGRGLLGRFLYAWPASMIGYRAVSAPPVPDAVRAAYEAVITGLLRLPVQQTAVTLDPAARARLLSFAERLERRMRPDDGDLAHMTDWAGKLIGATARIAGVCHAVERVHAGQKPWGVDISAATMERAIRMADEFLIPHALAAYGEMGQEPGLAAAQHVLRVVLKHDGTTITRRDLHERLRKRQGFQRAESLDAPLAVLVRHGWIRPAAREDTSGPGRPSEIYEINPQPQNPQNPQNPDRASENGNIADFADFAARGASAYVVPPATQTPGRNVVRL